MLQKTIKKKINVVRSRSFVHSFIYKILERKLNKKKKKKIIKNKRIDFKQNPVFITFKI